MTRRSGMRFFNFILLAFLLAVWTGTVCAEEAGTAPGAGLLLSAAGASGTGAPGPPPSGEKRLFPAEKYGIGAGLNYWWDALHSQDLSPRHSNRYRGLLELFVEVDTAKTGLWKGGELFIRAQNGHGKGINIEPGGVVMPISNIDAEDFTQISEYGIRQDLDGLRFYAGKQDANKIFCASKYAEHFIDPSYALIPTVPIPTFPTSAMGAAVFIEAGKTVSEGLGFYDGAPKVGGLGFDTFIHGKNGYLYLSETAWKPSFGGMAGNYRLGLWYHSGNFPVTDTATSETVSGNYGFYLLFDQLVYRSGAGPGRELGLFFQYGWAPEDRNAEPQYAGGGLALKGVFGSRPEDTLGLALSYNWIMAVTSPVGHKTNYTNAELFYNIKIADWLSIRPDVQYFRNPSDDVKNGWAGGMRGVIHF